MPEIHSPKQQRAQDVPIFKHWFNLIVTLILFACFLFIYILYINPYTRKGIDKFEAGDLAIFGFVLFIYIVYWIECCDCSTRNYLTNDMKIYEVESYIRELKGMAPLIGTKIECSHYKGVRGSMEMQKDREGKERLRPVSYEQRVITWTGSSYFNYATWEDKTGEIVGIFEEGKRGMIKMEVEISHSFADEETEKKYKAHRQDFITSNKHRDQFMDDLTLFEIPGHKKYVLLQNKWSGRLCCLSVNWFWFWSFFFLSWPYRMWLELVTNTKKIKIHKVISAQTIPDNLL